jgi:hypothetical protein
MRTNKPRKRRVNIEEKMRRPTLLPPGEAVTKKSLQGKALARRELRINNLPDTSLGIARLFAIDSERARSVATDAAPTERHNRK